MIKPDMVTVVVDVPCPLGRRGSVLTVEETSRVQRAIARGWVTVLRRHGSDDPDTVVDDTDEIPPIPRPPFDPQQDSGRVEVVGSRTDDDVQPVGDDDPDEPSSP